MPTGVARSLAGRSQLRSSPTTAAAAATTTNASLSLRRLGSLRHVMQSIQDPPSSLPTPPIHSPVHSTYLAFTKHPSIHRAYLQPIVCSRYMQLNRVKPGRQQPASEYNLQPFTASIIYGRLTRPACGQRLLLGLRQAKHAHAGVLLQVLYQSAILYSEAAKSLSQPRSSLSPRPTHLT